MVVLNKQKPYLTSRRSKDKFICEGATCRELGVSTDIFFRMLTLYVLGVERERIWGLDKCRNLTSRIHFVKMWKCFVRDVVFGSITCHTVFGGALGEAGSNFPFFQTVVN